MPDETDKYYNTLGLNPGASEAEVKEAYRDLVKVWHPDRFSHDPRLGEKANVKLREIIIAYDKLKSYLSEEAKRCSTSEGQSYAETQPHPDEPAPRSEKVNQTVSDKGPKESEPPPTTPPKQPFGQTISPEVKELSLYQQGFSFKGKHFKYDDIINLSHYIRVEKSTLFTNYAAVLYIVCDGNHGIKLKSYLKKDVEKIEQAYELLRIHSLNGRYHFYLNQLNEHGYIDYKGGSSDSIIKIHKNGIVEQGNKRVDLKIAKKNKLLRFETYSVVMSERGLGIFDKKISFDAYCDTDILTCILKELADGKSLN